MSNIRIRFTDGLNKQSLLTKLNISDTCVIRGDHYHLIHKVIPKAHNFGELVFACISKYLCNMLICKTVDEWENSFQSAAIVLKNILLKLEKLTDNYIRPQYYAGYYCTHIPGNLDIKGSVSIEANNSSIVRNFG